MRLTVLHPLPGHPVRGTDAWGSGAFGASRGDRTHAGVDIEANEGDMVSAPLSGVVRVGTCYSDTGDFQLVEISGEAAITRVLYVDPVVETGDRVEAGWIIGEAQDIASRYDRRMVNHVHWEIVVRPRHTVIKGAPGARVWIDPLLLV